MSLVSKPGPGVEIVVNGEASPQLQQFFDDVETMLNDALLGDYTALPSFTVASLPPANSSKLIFVSDETGGAVPAFSDGTNWRRTTDRAIVS